MSFPIFTIFTSNSLTYRKGAKDDLFIDLNKLPFEQIADFIQAQPKDSRARRLEGNHLANFLADLLQPFPYSFKFSWMPLCHILRKFPACLFL